MSRRGCSTQGVRAPVTSFILSALILSLLNGCGGSSGGGGLPAAAPDQDAPTVSITPVDGELDVVTNTSVVIHFSEPVINATQTSFSICPYTAGAPNCAQALSFRFNALNGNNDIVLDELRVSPAASPGLPMGTRYQVRVNENGLIQDQNENPLGAVTTWFETLALPTVVSKSPEGESGCATNISVTFSEPMNGDSVLAGFSVNNSLGGTPVYDNASNTLTFTPNDTLPRNTNYTVTLAASITDANGQPLSGGQYQWTFNTGSTAIDEIVPPSVKRGETVSIRGRCFGDIEGLLRLDDTNSVGPIQSWSDSEVTALVWESARTGELQITAGGQVSNKKLISVAWDAENPDNVLLTPTLFTLTKKMTMASSDNTVVVWNKRIDNSKDSLGARTVSFKGDVFVTDDVSISTTADHQGRFDIAPGQGGNNVFVVWADVRDNPTFTDIWLQSVTTSGVKRWDFTEGKLVFGDANINSDPLVWVNSDGDVIVAWKHHNSSTNIMVLPLDGVTGDPLIMSPATLGTNVTALEKARVSNTEMMLAWGTQSGGQTGITAQKIDDAGAPVWMAEVPLVSRTENFQYWNLVVVEDGAGGAIVAWVDYNRDSVLQPVYAQRIDADGNVLWTSNGVPICTATGYREQLRMAPDGNGGAFLSWLDKRNTSDDQVYMQYIDSTGTVQWYENGVPLVDLVTDRTTHANLASDGRGGAIVVWQDFDPVGAVEGVYAQRYSADGMTHWGEGGMAVATNPAGGAPDIIADGHGGAVVVFGKRNFSITDGLYVQGITRDGRQ